jgi:hypothetical protein
MSSRSIETGGDTPNNRGLSDFKVLPEQKGVGPRVQKPGERPLPSKPSEQKGEAKPFQPNPAEQQAAERLGKPPPEKQGEVVETLDPEVEEAIQQYGMAIGDPEKEAKLRESAKKYRSVRDSLVNPGSGLVYRIPSIPSFLKDVDDASDS